jgi:NADPH2:quinone reductase
VVGPGQVLLRIEAAVGAGETRMRSGAIPVPLPFPLVLGAEAAAVVEEVGEGVDPVVEGDTIESHPAGGPTSATKSNLWLQ